MYNLYRVTCFSPNIITRFILGNHMVTRHITPKLMESGATSRTLSSSSQTDPKVATSPTITVTGIILIRARIVLVRGASRRACDTLLHTFWIRFENLFLMKYAQRAKMCSAHYKREAAPKRLF